MGSQKDQKRFLIKTLKFQISHRPDADVKYAVIANHVDVEVAYDFSRQ